MAGGRGGPGLVVSYRPGLRSRPTRHDTRRHTARNLGIRHFSLPLHPRAEDGGRIRRVRVPLSLSSHRRRRLPRFLTEMTHACREALDPAVIVEDAPYHGCLEDEVRPVVGLADDARVPDKLADPQGQQLGHVVASQL
eukprot:scaffold15542_cov112-Isochrysis_galbana.AAC.4